MHVREVVRGEENDDYLRVHYATRRGEGRGTQSAEVSAGRRRRHETDIVRGTSGTPVTPALRDFPVSFPPICCTCRAQKQRKHKDRISMFKYDFCLKLCRNVSTSVVYVVEMST